MPRKSSHKHLTQRQRERISAIRERRLAHYEERRKQEVEELSAGGLGAQEDGLVIAHYGLNVEVEDSAGGRCRCAVRETVADNPVCGDRVVWARAAEGQGVITHIKPRHSVLRRPGPYNRLQTVAANLDRIVITDAPPPNLGLVDRYLVAAEALGVEPLLVINKIDQPHDPQALAAALHAYQRMGYPVLRVSARSGQGLDALLESLVGHTAIFVGQSGVGKSSLISRWLPAEEIRVGEENPVTGKGRHTTTVARLYHLPGGGRLIDSPGVRAFGLHGVAPEMVPPLFRDVAPYLGHCRFGDCSHQHEPGCAVRLAVAQGELSAERLASMQRIVASLKGE